MHLDPTTSKLVLITLALGLVVAVTYLRSLTGEFLNWDDPDYVTANPDLRLGLTWEMVKWSFGYHASNWHPLTWLSLALDYRLYGLDPRGYHVTSLSLHIANTLIVFLLLHRLTERLWPSAVVAALFGLHPMHVESVAWVAERKDVLSAFFSLLTVAAYARYARLRTWPAYASVVLLFALALLSKPMAVTIPAVLLLLDYWPLRRWSRQAVLEKLPLFGMSLGLTILTVAAQRAGGAVDLDLIPLGSRVAHALVAYVQYLRLTVWPIGLSPWYSHPALEGPPLTTWQVAGAVVLLATGTAVALGLRERRPYLAVGWGWYLITLAPVIGFLQVGRQGMADRFTYFAHVGVFFAMVWTAAEMPWSGRRWSRVVGTVAVGIVLASLATLTARHTVVWRNTMAFWSHTARVNPRAFIAHQALAGLFSSAGRFDEALVEFRRAAHLRPDIAKVHVQYGSLLMRLRQLGPAAAQYRKAVALEPDSADYQNRLADVLLTQKRSTSARRHLERALAAQPSFPEARNNLGRAFLAENRFDDAAAQFRLALQERPGFKAASDNLAAALRAQGEASRHP